MQVQKVLNASFQCVPDQQSTLHCYLLEPSPQADTGAGRTAVSSICSLIVTPISASSSLLLQTAAGVDTLHHSGANGRRTLDPRKFQAARKRRERLSSHPPTHPQQSV